MLRHLRCVVRIKRVDLQLFCQLEDRLLEPLLLQELLVPRREIRPAHGVASALQRLTQGLAAERFCGDGKALAQALADEPQATTHECILGETSREVLALQVAVLQHRLGVHLAHAVESLLDRQARDALKPHLGYEGLTTCEYGGSDVTDNLASEGPAGVLVPDKLDVLLRACQRLRAADFLLYCDSKRLQ